jgi:hypothetical protein
LGGSLWVAQPAKMALKHKPHTVRWWARNGETV